MWGGRGRQAGSRDGFVKVCSRDGRLLAFSLGWSVETSCMDVQTWGGGDKRQTLTTASAVPSADPSAHPPPPPEVSERGPGQAPARKPGGGAKRSEPRTPRGPLALVSVQKIRSALGRQAKVAAAAAPAASPCHACAAAARFRCEEVTRSTCLAFIYLLVDHVDVEGEVCVRVCVFGFVCLGELVCISVCMSMVLFVDTNLLVFISVYLCVLFTLVCVCAYIDGEQNNHSFVNLFTKSAN